MSPPAARRDRLTVCAFGGNAMMPPGEPGHPAQQIARAGAACGPLADLVAEGERLVVVFGNGPQVGRELDRGHAARHEVPPLPLEACVAATQGTMGYFLEVALRGALAARGVPPRVATLTTLVQVDRGDPAFAAPDKPVGPFVSEEEAARLAGERGARFAPVGARGHRRVVPSPMPVAVVEIEAIRDLVAAGHVVVTGGGGGIPVVQEEGRWASVPAVIDKDHTASLLARQLGASRLLDLTDVDFVYRDFESPRRIPLPRLDAAEARALLAQGQFPPGSMGPKVAAACAFVEAGGDEAWITSMGALGRALAGELGTRIARGAG